MEVNNKNNENNNKYNYIFFKYCKSTTFIVTQYILMYLITNMSHVYMLCIFKHIYIPPLVRAFIYRAENHAFEFDTRHSAVN